MLCVCRHGVQREKSSWWQSVLCVDFKVLREGKQASKQGESQPRRGRWLVSTRDPIKRYYACIPPCWLGDVTDMCCVWAIVTWRSTRYDRHTKHIRYGLCAYVC